MIQLYYFLLFVKTIILMTDTEKENVQKAFGRFRAVYFESGRTSLPLFLQRSFLSIIHVRLFLLIYHEDFDNVVVLYQIVLELEILHYLLHLLNL